MPRGACCSNALSQLRLYLRSGLTPTVRAISVPSVSVGSLCVKKVEKGRKSVVLSTRVCIIEDDGPMAKGCRLVAAPVRQVAFESEVSPKLDAHLILYALLVTQGPPASQNARVEA